MLMNQKTRSRGPHWALLFLLLAGSAGLVRAQDLAQPTDPVLSQQQQHYLSVIMGEPVYVEHIYVNLDFEALEFTALNLNLPGQDGGTVRVVRDAYDKTHETHADWMGHVEGFPHYTFNSVRRGENFRAILRLGNDQYSIHPIGEGLHILALENPQNYPLDHDPAEWDQVKDEVFHPREEPRLDPVAEGSAFGSEAAAAECAVRVLVAYTDDVQALRVDPHLEIILANQNYNAANNNSFVFHDVEIARIVEVSYVEPGNLSTALADFEGTSDGKMDNIHSLRGLYDADLCQLITDNSGSCGLASGIGSSFSTGFCVSDYGCIAGNLTYAHEFGHLYGARHDTYVDGSTTPYAFGHGWVNVADNWRTVMAYNDQCADAGTSCTRLQYWSNPAVTYGGDPMGSSATADNESVLDIEDLNIANYEASQVNKVVFSSDIIGDDETGQFWGSTSISTGTANLTVQSGGDLVMKAGSTITLAPGFRANNGSTFRAFISSSCSTISDAPSREADPEPQDDLAANRYRIQPNPADQATRIHVDLDREQDVFVAAYDLKGQMLRVLLDRSDVPAGPVYVDWNTSQLAAGTYLVRIITGGEENVARVMVQH